MSSPFFSRILPLCLSLSSALCLALSAKCFFLSNRTQKHQHKCAARCVRIIVDNNVHITLALAVARTHAGLAGPSTHQTLSVDTPGMPKIIYTYAVRIVCVPGTKLFYDVHKWQIDVAAAITFLLVVFFLPFFIRLSRDRFFFLDAPFHPDWLLINHILCAFERVWFLGSCLKVNRRTTRNSCRPPPLPSLPISPSQAAAVSALGPMKNLQRKSMPRFMHFRIEFLRPQTRHRSHSNFPPLMATQIDNSNFPHQIFTHFQRSMVNDSLDVCWACLRETRCLTISRSSAVPTDGTDGSLTSIENWEYFLQRQINMRGIFEYDIVECELLSDVDAEGLKPDWFVCCFSRQHRRIDCWSGFSCHRQEIETQNFQNEIRIFWARVREFKLFFFFSLVFSIFETHFPETWLVTDSISFPWKMPLTVEKL